MNLFKKNKQKLGEKSALEKLVKETFCGKQSVVGCDYSNKVWCPRTCGFYIKSLNKTKYWTR